MKPIIVLPFFAALLSPLLPVSTYVPDLRL